MLCDCYQYGCYSLAFQVIRVFEDSCGDEWLGQTIECCVESGDGAYRCVCVYWYVCHMCKRVYVEGTCMQQSFFSYPHSHTNTPLPLPLFLQPQCVAGNSFDLTSPTNSVRTSAQECRECARPGTVVEPREVPRKTKSH